MSLSLFIEKVTRNEPVSFDETMAVIADNYRYTPAEFINGLNDDCIVNAAGVNEGSCKIFAFAQIHGLDRSQTLSLFGDYYRRDVLGDPTGSGHRNIRLFIKYGWDGIKFRGTALAPK